MSKQIERTVDGNAEVLDLDAVEKRFKENCPTSHDGLDLVAEVRRLRGEAHQAKICEAANRAVAAQQQTNVEELIARVVSLRRELFAADERNAALEAAGDALAEAVEGLKNISARAGGQAFATEAWERWREARGTEATETEAT